MAGPLILGPVVFDGFEVPQRVRFGGRQRLAVHVLPGGGRVVDAMGADDAPLHWSGAFAGPAAADRARLLDVLRRSGAALPLLWNVWRYTVVIDCFEAEWANPAWIPYRLRCCVVSSSAQQPLDWLAGTAAADIAGLSEAAVDAEVAAAELVLGADDVAASIGAAGTLARAVAGRSMLAFPAGTENVS